MLKRPMPEWVELFEAAGVPCGPINNYRQVFEDPQVVHRQRQVEAPRADGAMVQMIASPLNLKGTPPTYRNAPPTLGEHTDDILAEMLGKSAEDIAALRDKKVI